MNSFSLSALEADHQFPNLAYFQKEYLTSQNHKELIIAENDHFFIPFSLDDNLARSIPRSPFGSYYLKEEDGDFDLFHKKMIQQLQEKGIQGVEINHPSSIYESFLPITYLKDYHTGYQDINQHIRLDEDWESRIHQMQTRKLKSLKEEGFEFRRIPLAQLETVYQFLKVCREAQGIQINISWDLLSALVEKMPNTYECFGVFREEKISAVCISVNVTENVAYYYLPGTSPMFRSQSPMVLLIAGMVAHYRSKGFEFFDMGVSSVLGKPQETLKLFKERMGAEETNKAFLKLAF